MLTHHPYLIPLALISSDLSIISTIETSATLDRKDYLRFCLLLDRLDTVESKLTAPIIAVE